MDTVAKAAFLRVHISIATVLLLLKALCFVGGGGSSKSLFESHPPSKSTGKPYTWAATICWNKLDAGRLKCIANRPLIRRSDRGYAVVGFRAPYGRHPHAGGVCQILCAPTHQRARRSHLRASDIFHII